MLETLAVQNYRTLRDFVIPLRSLSLVTGVNGSGKSNIYKALRLLAGTAQGGAIAALAHEGGIESALWAGPASSRESVVSLGLGFTGSEFSYAIDLGLQHPSTSAFSRDPMIKGEYLWAGTESARDGMLAERRGAVLRSRGEDGKWQLVHQHMASFDSMLSHAGDPRRTPELLMLRLIAALEAHGCQTLTHDKHFGETTIPEPADLDRPAWKWIAR